MVKMGQTDFFREPDGKVLCHDDCCKMHMSSGFWGFFVHHKFYSLEQLAIVQSLDCIKSPEHSFPPANGPSLVRKRV